MWQEDKIIVVDSEKYLTKEDLEAQKSRFYKSVACDVCGEGKAIFVPGKNQKYCITCLKGHGDHSSDNIRDYLSENLDDAIASTMSESTMRLSFQKPESAPLYGMPGRNDPCRCGSGKKYKKCCSGSDLDQRNSAAHDAFMLKLRSRLCELANELRIIRSIFNHREQNGWTEICVSEVPIRMFMPIELLESEETENAGNA